METTVKITGLDETLNRLRMLGVETQAKNLVSSAYSAMLPMQNQARANIISDGTVRTGLLSKSIGRVKRVYPANETLLIRLGVDSRAKGYYRGHLIRPVKYAHFIEKKNQPIKRAYETHKTQVFNRFVSVLERKLKKAGV